MTKLALIPPLPNLELGGDMHMLLAHMCYDPTYVQFYRKRSIQGDFLILDNSAYEMTDAQASIFDLLAIAYCNVRVDEIVAPDQIMHERATYAHALESISVMSSAIGQLAWKRAGSPRIMVVPQVSPNTQSIDSYDRHARLLMDMWHHGAPYLAGHITLGVSKNMDKLHGGWLLIFREVIKDLIKEYPLQVHVLGLPHRLTNTRRVLKENSYIRSIDTAQPFISAIAGQTMQVHDQAIARRPEDYLETPLTENQIHLALENIQWMNEWFTTPGPLVMPG